MSAYQGYPQGQGPGGYDERRAWAPGNPPDGRYSKIETDPLVTSMAQSAPMSRVVPGGGETYKQPAPYSGKDSTGVSRRKRTRFDTGGLPVKGQGQNGDWRCSMRGVDVRAYESPNSVAPTQPAGFVRPVIPARPVIPVRPTIPARPAVPVRPTVPARPAYPVPQKVEPPNRKVRISGLAVKTPGYKLMSYFCRWGGVDEFEVVKDLTLRSTGVAFVIFEKLADAVKAVSGKPHVIDDKEVEVSYAKPHENLPSETFSSWREQRPRETIQQQRLPESIISLDQGYDPPEARKSRSLEDAQPRRLPEVYQRRRQSTPEPLIPGLTQVDSVPDVPLVTEYECNVSGCSFKGESGQFDRHWTKIHEAKVLYLICSFCSMECVDADDLREHLDFFSWD
ncbi:uncharacterized protein LOC124277865 [Haliotis rubra]|uniref:uncharacterized protein LOC124277865 n=1 Tax=Haliotis rubra TaxID=36100 RepID=UPI001EE55CDC|nr:uncharacterized protein LOC124277865 [Haliotis rubra]